MKTMKKQIEEAIDDLLKRNKKKGMNFNTWWKVLSQYHAMVRFFSEQPNKEDPWWKEYHKKGVKPIDAILAWDKDCDTWQWPESRQ